MRDQNTDSLSASASMAKYSYRMKSLDGLMEALGWTGTELAEHLGVNQNTLSNWKRGHTPVPKVVYLYLELLLKFRNAGP